MDGDNIVAEVRRLSDVMDRLMAYIEGDKYQAGLLVEMKAIRADIAEMKSRRERLDQQRKERRSFSWMALFMIPLVGIVESGLLISDIRHALDINALTASIATVILQVLLISLVATTVYVLMH